MKEKVVKLTGVDYDNSKYLYYVAKDKESGEVYVWRTERSLGRKPKK